MSYLPNQSKKPFNLLSRDQFRDTVFQRDKHQCIVCKNPAQDAHHIIERKLWNNGGYYLENGASLCELCHLQAEDTTISCNQLREAAGIIKFPVPHHLYPDQEIDKWGNFILNNGMRLPGEMFHEPQVQKVLAPMMHLFTSRIKYPRTPHLPWSPGLNDQECELTSFDEFEKADQVIVSIKMDGENTTMYSDYIHARSTECNPHLSRNWVKALHGSIAHNIPAGWRLCGENLYAKHSIKYNNLESYFQVFSVWNDKNQSLSWEETKEWCALLDLKTVPIIYQGKWDRKLIENLDLTPYQPIEGYVVRVAREFHYKEFRNCMAKWVRKNHIQTDEHWKNQEIEPNGLKL